MEYIGPHELRTRFGNIGLYKKVKLVYCNLIQSVDYEKESDLIEDDDSLDFCSMMQDESTDTKNGVKFINLKDKSTNVVQWKRKISTKSKTEES